MNKSELIEAVAAETGLSKADAARAVDATFNIIVKSLANKISVVLVGIGTFGTKLRAARTGKRSTHWWCITNSCSNGSVFQTR